MSKKSLLIGINYTHTSHELRGCHNDIESVNTYLKKIGFDEPVLLLDRPGCIYPTRNNILSEMRKFISTSKEGDLLYIHYSGHGSYTRDQNGDERDGKDELICPLDGFITDDDLFRILVKGLPQGVKLRVVFDCCHSGSALDLCCRYLCGNKIIKESENSQVDKDVIMFSGCRDTQTSADAYIDGDYSGALTWAFVKTLEYGKEYFQDMNWKDLLFKTRFKLKKGKYSQVPQLSTTRKDLLSTIVDLF